LRGGKEGRTERREERKKAGKGGREGKEGRKRAKKRRRKKKTAITDRTGRNGRGSNVTKEEKREMLLFWAREAGRLGGRDGKGYLREGGKKGGWLGGGERGPQIYEDNTFYNLPTPLPSQNANLPHKLHHQTPLPASAFANHHHRQKRESSGRRVKKNEKKEAGKQNGGGGGGRVKVKTLLTVTNGLPCYWEPSNRRRRLKSRRSMREEGRKKRGWAKERIDDKAKGVILG
jgi:hypothetical protein